MEELISILSNLKHGVDFTKETDLVGKHILTSFDIITLVSQLTDEFDIEIRLPEIKPENFYSADTIYAMIERLQDED